MTKKSLYGVWRTGNYLVDHGSSHLPDVKCGKWTEGEKGAEEETGTSQRASSHSLIFIVLLGRILVKLV